MYSRTSARCSKPVHPDRLLQLGTDADTHLDSGGDADSYLDSADGRLDFQIPSLLKNKGPKTVPEAKMVIDKLTQNYVNKVVGKADASKVKQDIIDIIIKGKWEKRQKTELKNYHLLQCKIYLRSYNGRDRNQYTQWAVIEDAFGRSTKTKV